jgi:hypothetical protein
METEMTMKCPECGTAWPDGKTCQEAFHQMLFWEAEYPELGEVHHLMVLSYHLQHPTLYSPKGLIEAMKLLELFVDQGIQPDLIRRQASRQVDSRKRKWKIRGSANLHGAYDHPVHWTMTAADVTAAEAQNYRENVRRWAQSIREILANM